MTRHTPTTVLVLALFINAALALMSRPARASLDVTVSLTDLARWSSAVAVVTTLDGQSEWEGGRIVTLSRVRVDTVVAGGASSSELLVRTLGGTIGDVAQRVDGEPKLVPGQSCLLFLQRLQDGVFGVSARAQGQFDVRRDESGRAILAESAGLGTLVGRPAAIREHVLGAVAELRGVLLDAALIPITEAWGRTHAH